ncbi:MAG TPA: TAXI family TRAP transporter solute-binding subunit [Stellaceae bacterium]|nr:TAXI family TRAP transporter solute-binding subunit [Stellaceae bacterium]
MTALDLKMAVAGANWIAVGSQVTLGMTGYYSPLPKGSTVSMVAGDPGEICMDAPMDVADGKYHFAFTTPSWYAVTALEGRYGAARKPSPLRTIANFPHDDRLIFAVKRETGVTSLGQIVKDRVKLKAAVPGPGRHPCYWVADLVLREYGASLEALEGWGGKLVFGRPRNMGAPGEPAVNGEWDAVFDEAIMNRRWEQLSTENDLIFLSIDEPVLQRFTARGMPRGIIPKGRMRGIERDVATLDLSGHLLFCREDLPDEVAYLATQAIDEKKAAIDRLFPPPYAALTSPIDMRFLAASAPLPLHRGAEKYYREKGYI